MDENNRNNRQGGDGQPPRQNIFIFLIATLAALLVISFLMSNAGHSSSREISYNEFISMIGKNQIERVTIESDQITIYPKNENPTPVMMGGSAATLYTGKVEDDSTLTARLLEAGIEVSGDVPNVVFPCAALLEEESGKIAIYYGAADTSVGLAFTTVDETVKYIKEHNLT